MKTGARCLVTATAMLILAGCSSFEQRVVAVETRQSALEAQLADIQASQQTIIGRLVQLRQEVDNALQPIRTQSADRGEDLRSMRREITALEDEVAQLETRIGRLTEQIASGQGAPSGTPDVGVAMPPPRGARATSGRQAAPTDNEASRLYNSAYNDYLRENYDLCIQGFREYIRRYSSSAQADNAQYWIGNCERDRGQISAARSAFQSLLRDYPDSELVPDAMLNDALILRQQDQGGAAIEALRRLIVAYPTTDAAFLACGQLDDMGVDRPASCDEGP